MSVFDLCDTLSAGAWIFLHVSVSRLFFHMIGFFQPLTSTYMVLKLVVYIWLIVFQVHLFNIPWQDYTFGGQIQGALSSLQIRPAPS